MLKSTYLASGTYGCVAKPAFKCDNRNETTDNTIMKLFADKDNYKEEIKKQMQIQTIDPESNFTIKMISKCETDINFINTSVNNINKCKLIKNKSNIYQIIYEDGGKDLSEFFINIQPDFDSLEFLKLFINLFNGIKKLIDNELAHSDIRLDNLLYNGNKIILIDFGWLLNFNKLIESIEHSYYENAYYLPDDFYLSINIYRPYYDKINTDYLLELIKEKINRIANFQYNYPEYFEKSQELYNYIKTQQLKKWVNTDINQAQLIGSKLDIYQLGIVLYEIVLSIIHLYDRQMVEKIPLAIFEIIKKMIEPDVAKRIDINTLIREYSQLFS